MRLVAGVPSGCTVIGMRSSEANTLRMFSWMRHVTLSVNLRW